MRSVRRSAVTAITAAIALAIPGAALLIATPPPSSGEELVATSTVGSVSGSLSLDTAANLVTGFVEDYAANRTDLPAQDLTGSKSSCQLTGVESLLAFTGTVGTRSGDFASYANGSIGVAEKKTGTSCSQVNTATAERLTITLGSDLDQALFDAAVLDVELKQSAIIDGVGLLDGQEVATFDLFSGSAQGQAGADDFKCVGSADSGPDSGPNDNCSWPIGEVGDGIVFDTILLTARAGSFSVEGGGDGAPTAPSTFELVSAGFECNTSVTLPAADGAPEVTGTRLVNADGTECTPVKFSFSNGTSEDGAFAELLKPADVDPSAQFVYDFVWTVLADTDPTDETETTGLVNRTMVDFDSADTLDDPTPIPSCPALEESTVTVVDENGVSSTETFFIVPGMPDNEAAEDQAPNIPNKQYACIVDVTIAPVVGSSPAQQTVTETIYAYGDILMKKP